MALKCGWQPCDHRFEIIEDLEYHACFHSIDVAKDTDEKFIINCQWSGCNKLIHEDINAPGHLPRHILRHCMEEHLIMVGKQVVGEALCNNDESEGLTPLSEVEFTCKWTDCTFTSESSWSYYVHTRSHLKSFNEKPIICQWESCSQIVEDDDMTAEHMKRHTGEPFSMCQSCRSVFSSADEFKAHFKESNSYRCLWIDCGKDCISIEELDVHIAEHVHDLDPYQPCGWKDCSWQFPGLIRSTEDKLIMQTKLHCHLFRHTYSVERCHYAKNILKKSKYNSLPPCKWFTNRESNQFDKELLDADTFVCKWLSCMEQFTNPRLYFRHVAQHVPSIKTDPQPSFTCKWQEDAWSNRCNMKCSSLPNLQRHLQTHTNEYKLQCETCYFAFKSSNVFAEHLMSQTNPSDSKVIQHVCHYCKRNFASKHYLNSHLISHKKEFPCTTCQQIFPTEYAMRKHCRLTHQRSAYRCSFCSPKLNGKFKEFASKDSLNRHVKNIHVREISFADEMESEMIYVCSESECGFSTSKAYQYKNHWLNCHSKESNHYICHICYSIFQKSTKITNHLKYIHNFKPKPPYDNFAYEMSDDGFFRLADK